MRKQIFSDDKMRVPLATESMSLRRALADESTQREVGATLPVDQAEECKKFADAHPEYHPCAENWHAMRGYMERYALPLTAQSLHSAWVWMRANHRGKTVAMAAEESSPQLTYRKIDNQSDREIASEFHGIVAARKLGGIIQALVNDGCPQEFIVQAAKQVPSDVIRSQWLVENLESRALALWEESERAKADAARLSAGEQARLARESTVKSAQREIAKLLR